MIESIVKELFEQLKDCPKSDIIEQRYASRVDECKTKLDRAKVELQTCQNELAEYEAEVIKVIRGQSQFNSDLLNRLCAEAEEKTVAARAEVVRLENELQNSCQMLDDLSQEYDALLKWSDVFDESSMEEKKMILTHIIKAVKVSRDYELDIDMNVTCEQFGLSMEM